MSTTNVCQDIDSVVRSYYNSPAPSISRLLYESDMYADKGIKTTWKYLDIDTDKPYHATLLGRLQYGMCMIGNFLFPMLCNKNWLRLGLPSDTLSGQLLFDAQVNVLQGLYEKDQDERLSCSWIYGRPQKYILIYVDPLSVVHLFSFTPAAVLIVAIRQQVHGPSDWDDDSNVSTVGREYVKTEEILHVAELYPVRLEVSLRTHVSHSMKEKFELFALHMCKIHIISY
ncbi:hypothetical protein EDD85DRAFT_1026327 [Armillaria nabsnona]|nr:hypothetical protein EDD85DRAFT_1026327 [Armillaria nabsnona]